MEESRPKVRHRDLFISFLKIGLFTFGGGYAMVPLIEQEVVSHRGWIKGSDFLDLLTLAQSIPGPISLNSSAFVGYNSRGYTGALAAILGAILPSFVIILVVALFFSSIRENQMVEAAFKAMRPVVIALIISPMLSFMRGMGLLSVLVVLAVVALIVLLEISPAILIFAAGVGSMLWTLFQLRRQNRREEGER